jgi:hypothetical protein
VLLTHLGVGLLVGLVLLLLVTGVAFAVGGTVGGLPGDLVGLLGLLGLLACPCQVASPQQPPWAVFEGGDRVAGLLPPGGRLGQPLGQSTDRPEVAKAANARRTAHLQGRAAGPDHPWRRPAVVRVAERSMAAAS